MKSCRKRGSKSITKYPCMHTCPWLCLMREFSQKHEEKCNTVEIPEPSCETHEFLTGSSYDGEWQEGCGMHGHGVYKFTNAWLTEQDTPDEFLVPKCGDIYIATCELRIKLTSQKILHHTSIVYRATRVIYVGEFFEGTFHGKGELLYQTPAGKAVIRGQWYKGLMTKRTLLFDGVLEHDPKDWQYCKMPDRRFSREYAVGVQPGGKSFMTAYEPYVDVPEGYYDTGDGFFDITRKMIYEHDDYTKILRSATKPVRRGPAIAEQRWIQENCRVGKPDLIIGPRQDLYETFIEPTTHLEPVPPPPAKFTAVTRQMSIFEQYETLDDAPVFYDASKFGADLRPPERKFKH